ncbi:amidohydrolase family protein [Streptomyces asoensis]|uniref:amidohydrolase family protein n=1 Tax=Streptomyces asoensis TaxID=249586 RepID=UPI0033C33656
MTSGLIDVHAHHLPDFYVQQATAAGHDHLDGMAAWPAWSVRDHLDLMDRSGIETAMLSLSSPGVHFGDDTAARLLARRVNTYTAEVARDHPGRFGNFASLPLPDLDGALEEIAFALDELGADRVALLTHTHGVYLGDARRAPVFAELDRRGAVVTAGVLTRHPDLRIIVPHCGGAIPVLADRINEYMQLFVPALETPPRDAVQQLRTLYYDIAGTAFPRQAPALLQLADPARVLFGSDYCWTPAPLADTHIAPIDAAGPPAEGVTWRSLTTANAQGLFPRAAPRRTT